MCVYLQLHYSNESFYRQIAGYRMGVDDHEAMKGGRGQTS